MASGAGEVTQNSREPQTEPAREPEHALEDFFAPSFGQLREARLQDWASGFGSDDLGDEILANPRFEDRILAQLVPHLTPEDISGTQDEAALSLVLSSQRARFELMLGMAWCHATVLEWVTWNMLAEKIPDATLADARAAITAVPAGVRDTAGAKRRPDPHLTQATIRKAGKNLLNIWASSLTAPVLDRLMLFVAVTPAKDPGRIAGSDSCGRGHHRRGRGPRRRNHRRRRG